MSLTFAHRNSLQLIIFQVLVNLNVLNFLISSIYSSQKSTSVTKIQIFVATADVSTLITATGASALKATCLTAQLKSVKVRVGQSTRGVYRISLEMSTWWRTDHNIYSCKEKNQLVSLFVTIFNISPRLKQDIIIYEL